MVGDSQINNFRFKCSLFKFCFTNFNSFVVTCIRVQNLNLSKLLEIIELCYVDQKADFTTPNPSTFKSF